MLQSLDLCDVPLGQVLVRVPPPPGDLWASYPFPTAVIRGPFLLKPVSFTSLPRLPCLPRGESGRKEGGRIE